MLELLFVIGFFVMLLVTGVSLLGIIAALVVATVVMFIGGLFALMLKLLPWLPPLKNSSSCTLHTAELKKEKGFPREAQFLFSPS